MPRSAFTLVELLIVIAIIAIISTVVVLVLNPAELLRQSRDANRVSDMGILRSAFGVYASMSTTGSLGPSGNLMSISISGVAATSSAGDNCQGTGTLAPPSTWISFCAASSTYRSTDGTGWIPVIFSSLPGGSPIGQLPIDPVNATSSNLFYTYSTDGSQYEVTAQMESKKYSTGGSNDVESADNGQYNNLYEQGTDLSVLPFNPAGWTGAQSGDLLGTRALNTVYQNTSTNDLFVSVLTVPEGTGSAWGMVDPTNPPTDRISQGTGNGGWVQENFFLVPPGYYYEIGYDTGTSIQHWFEWTISGVAAAQTAYLAGSSRFFNTVYQNTSSQLRFVQVMSSAGGTGSAWFLSDSNTTPTTFISGNTGGNSWGRNAYAIVPPGHYYELTYDTGSDTLWEWVETSLSGLSVTQSGNLAGTVRAFNTVYQNTSTYPIFVSVEGHAGGTGSMSALTDASSPPSAQVAGFSGDSNWQRTLFFMVLPGNYYKVSYDTASTLDDWIEWRASVR